MSSEYFTRTSLYLIRLKIFQRTKILRIHLHQIQGNWSGRNFVTASRVAWISDDVIVNFESFSPLSNIVTEGVKTAQGNRLKFRLPRVWIYGPLRMRMQGCRNWSEISNYQRIQLAINKLINGILEGTLGQTLKVNAWPGLTAKRRNNLCMSHNLWTRNIQIVVAPLDHSEGMLE